ncbi:hypothetical protein ACWX0P_29230 [Vibrio mediterranei]
MKLWRWMRCISRNKEWGNGVFTAIGFSTPMDSSELRFLMNVGLSD